MSYLSKKFLMGKGKKDFVSTWDTTKTLAGGSSSTQVKLPFQNYGSYNLIVDWGDGSSDVILTYNQAETLHTYASSGVYTITIKGDFNGFSFYLNTERLKIKSIESWGGFTIYFAVNFNGCSNLNLETVSDVPKVIQSILISLFQDCNSLTSINNINLWDFSTVTSLYRVFSGCSKFNQDLTLNTTSSLVNTSEMFFNCALFNSTISMNTSSVTNMSSMFSDCAVFNKYVSGITTASATNMVRMFFNCRAFNQSLSHFDTGNVTDMNLMFYYNYVFNQALPFNMSKVTNINQMFHGATAFNQDISDWDVSKVTNAGNVMYLKTALNYSASNLDLIYNKWSLLVLKPSVSAGFGSIKYTAAGVAGKAILTGSPNNWTITDGGI